MTIEDWLASACADADRRGLPGLKPLLSALADATRALRAVDWYELLSAAPPAWPSATRGLPALPALSAVEGSVVEGSAVEGSAVEGKTPGDEEQPDADRRAQQPSDDDNSSRTAHSPQPGDGTIR